MWSSRIAKSPARGIPTSRITVVVNMKTIAAGTFKANCLAIMDEVKAKRETVVITKHGQPVAMLVPVSSDADDIFGFFSGKGSIAGDVLAPALSPEEWGSLR